jgi:CBS domain-containing protein
VPAPQEPAAPADHVRFIRSHPPFDGLDDAALACVVEASELVYLPRGERVLAQGGAPARHMYLIRKGAVRLERDAQTVIVLEEGDLFGFPSLTSGDPPAFDVVTSEDTLAYRISPELCADLLGAPAWRDFLVHGLQERLRRTAREPGAVGTGLTEAVGSLVRRPAAWLPASDTVRSAARLMRERGISSVLIEGDPAGIVTDRDLRNRVLADGLGPDATLGKLASRPLLTLPADAAVHEAVAFMLRHQVHHLPLTGDDGITGVITNGDLLRHRSQSPLHLARRLGHLDSPAAAEGYAEEVAGTVERLFDQGVGALRIGRVIAGLNDTLVRGALRLAEAQLGPPPAHYEWIVFGSEGRLEQTLLTDQDNALIWADSDSDSDSYFEELARRVVGTLLRAGFPRCAGGYMATRWAMPMSQWVARFDAWIDLDEHTALLDAANFFDFRGVRGTLSLDPLHELLERAGRNQIFLAHLAAASARFRPPLGLFGRLKDHDGTVDLKGEGLLPIVGLARVHALGAGSRARSTPARLADAADAGSLAHHDADTLAEAFEFLLRLRLRTQLEDRRSGNAPTNAIALDDLSTLERRHLKEAFLVVRDAQDVLGQRYQTGRLG